MNLKRTAIRSTVWRLLESSVSQFLALAVFMVLARMLNPQAYGIIAIATVFIAFLTTLSNFGIQQTIIQRERLLPEQLSSLFYLSCVLSGVIYFFLWCMAPIISRLFETPELEAILPWLGMVVVLNGLCTVHRGLLIRQFKFKYLAVRSISGIAFGGVIGIGMAFQGYTVWALVGQQLTTSIVSTLILWFSSGWFPRHSFSWRQLSSMITFNMHVLGTQLMGIINGQVDNLLIGVFLGPTALGIYSIGYKIFGVTKEIILLSMSSIALPTFSRLQNDLRKIRSAYYSSVMVCTAITWPIFLIIILVSEDLVPALFGQQWKDSASILQFLMIICCVYSITHFNASVLLALEKSNVVLKLSVIDTLLTALAIIISVQLGIIAVAAALSIKSILILPLSIYLLNTFASTSFESLIATVKGPLIGTVGLVVAMMAAGDIFFASNIWTAMLVEIAAGATIYIITIYLFDRALCRRLYILFRLAVWRK